jgi:adenine-specific DNA methylase
MSTFIETQFPIARLSAESYKERKANNGQTLTRLGKWWGRKPLVLVRAAILGMLMPASNDARKDREIFLKVLTMDDQGVWERIKDSGAGTPWRNDDIYISRAAFDALPYADRLRYCERPENVEGPSGRAWAEINAHLGTTANSLAELVEQLGQRSFGHTPRVGDCFCGGGSIPFEAARIGCEAFGSDLNPVAGLLTWASLNLLGGGKAVQEEVMWVQTEALQAADRRVTEWGIEHNERGERADAFLYCVEVKPEGCDYFIPLAPSWLVGEKSKVVARWRRAASVDFLEPEIAVVTDAELKLYKEKKGATVIDSRVIDPFDDNRSWSVEALRGPNGLRRWTNDDLVPRPGDVFQERLYCIRWVKTVMHNGKPKEIRRYAAPDTADLAREAKVLTLLRERLAEWQREGFIPSKAIPEGGAETHRLFRERGWTHWHHLFTPRQLLTHGLLAEISGALSPSNKAKLSCLLGIGNLSNWNSRLSSWLQQKGNEKGNNTFYNQSLNTFYNYSVRPMLKIGPTWTIFDKALEPAKFGKSTVSLSDARDLRENCDFWITDPPYADAVHYHELGDFFLAWYDKQLTKVFPEWIPDARAELAVRGDGEDFHRSMVEIYRNLARHMPDNGMQMVMFTHQNPAVWADLGMILWAAGLKATAAWTISTETDAAGFKMGNYVQGTVCLVLRKRVANEPGFLDEVYPLVEDEVKRQLASMQSLDEGGEPNFNDADYQLAAYAAALKVLTQYGNLDGKDVEHKVFTVRAKNEKSDFQIVIERALSIACNTLVPVGLEPCWRKLSLIERYYLRALDIESRGERRKGMYEELARGFGITDVKPLLKSDKANGARMFTPSGLAAGLLAPLKNTKTADAQSLPARRGRASSAQHPFAAAPLRHLMFAICETTDADNSPEPGRQYLRDTFGQGYWGKREGFIGLLEWLASLGNAEGMNEWSADSEAARILVGRLRNDHA